MAREIARILGFILETDQLDLLTDFYSVVFGWRMLEGGGGFALDNTPVAACRRGPSPGWMPAIDGSGLTVSQLGPLGFRCVPIDASGLVATDESGVRTQIEPHSTSLRSACYEPSGSANGRPSWLQLNTSCAKKSLPLYSSLLGWEIGESSNEKYTYLRFNYDDMAHAGAMLIDRRSGESIADGWQVYFHWDELDGVAERILSGGGTVIVPATRIVSGQFLVATDPEGNVFGVDDMVHASFGPAEQMP